MKKSILILSSTLFAAAGTLSAETVELTTEITQISGSVSSSMGSGNTYKVSGESNGVVDGVLQLANPWAGTLTGSFVGTVSGTGTLEMIIKGGNGSSTYDITISDADFSGFEGQLSVVNVWNRPTVVNVGGDKFSKTEYLFPYISRENSWTNNRAEDTQNSLLDDKLNLASNTTLAGISGTSENYYFKDGFAKDHEFITGANGTTLTLAGAGTYAFYGTVGTSSARLSLNQASTAGTGTQTFGGTNYLQNVAVSAGTLNLAGTTDVAGTITVSGGTLNLSGNITLSGAISNNGGTISLGNATVANAITLSAGELTIAGLVDLGGHAIQNAGTIHINSEGKIQLSNFAQEEYSAGDFVGIGVEVGGDARVYTIFEGTGSWNNTEITTANFLNGEAGLSARKKIYASATTGKVVIWGAVESLTWNGEDNATWLLNQEATKQWINSGSAADHFVEGDNVTFGGSTEGRIVGIDAGASVVVGTMSVAGNHSFSAAAGTPASITASTLQLTLGKTAAFENANLNFGGVSVVGSGEDPAKIYVNSADTYSLGVVSGAGKLALEAGDGVSASFGIDNINTGTTVSVGDRVTVVLANANKTDDTNGSLNLSGEAVLDLRSSSSSITRTVSGTGTVKFESTADGHGVGLNLGNDFTGTIDFAGRFNPNSFGGSKATKIILSQNSSSAGSMWGGDNCSFAKAILFKTYQIGDSSRTTITLSGDLEIAAGATLTVGGTSTTLTISKSLVINDNAVFKTSSGTTTISGTVSGNGSFNVAGGTLTFNGEGTVNASSLEISAATTTVTFSKNAKFSGAISTKTNAPSGTGRKITIGEGVTVSAKTIANSWGLTTLTVNGILNLTGTDASDGCNYSSGDVTNTITGTGTINAKRLYVSNVGTYVLNGGIRINLGSNGVSSGDSRPLQILNATLGAQSNWTMTANNVQLGGGTNSGVTFDTNGHTITVSQALKNYSTEAGNLTKIGEGTLKLSAANTFTGATTISAGTLEISNTSALSTSSGVTIEENGTLSLGVSSATVKTLAGTGTISKTIGETATLDITTSSTFAGTINQGVVLAVADGQALTVSAGKEAVLNGAITGAVSVGANSKLKVGTNSLTGTTIAATGAGSQIVLTKTITTAGENAITLSEGAKIFISADFESADPSSMSSSSLGGYSVFGLGDPVPEDKALYLIATNSISGFNASNISDYFELDAAYNSYNAAYSVQNDYVYLTLTIPEPSAFGLLAGLGALALAGTRRRRKAK